MNVFFRTWLTLVAVGFAIMVLGLIETNWFVFGFEFAVATFGGALILHYGAK